MKSYFGFHPVNKTRDAVKRITERLAYNFEAQSTILHGRVILNSQISKNTVRPFVSFSAPDTVNDLHITTSRIIIEIRNY